MSTPLAGEGGKPAPLDGMIIELEAAFGLAQSPEFLAEWGRMRAVGGIAAVDGLSAKEYYLWNASSKFPPAYFQNAATVAKCDERALLQHWPWLALSVDQLSAVQRAAASGMDLEPKDLLKLLNDVGSHAQTLHRLISRLVAIASLRRDMTSSSKSITLDKIAAKITAQLGGFESPPLDPADLTASLEQVTQALAWVARLDQLSVTSKAFAEQTGRSSLATSGGSHYAGLVECVSILAKLWFSLVGKKASPHAIRGSVNAPPPFVRFVRAVVTSAGYAEPTTAQIRQALRTLK